MNIVMLTGRLGKDPELRGEKKNVCVFSMATNETRKKGDEWEKYAEWHNIVVLGNSASSAARYLKKGSRVAIKGKLQTRTYEGKDGSTRYTTEIIADMSGGVEFQDSKQDNSSEKDTYAQKHGLKSDNIDLFDDDDIPF